MVTQVLEGTAWLVVFVLVFPKIAQAMTAEESLFTVAALLLLTLISFIAFLAAVMSEGDNGESVVGAIKRRRRPRWRRY
jgi:uncharacterized membrane protein YhaH (DUF805 family)